MGSNWESRSIGEISVRVAMGPFGSNIKKDNYCHTGVPVIRGLNLNAERFRNDGFVFVSEAKADEVKSSTAYPGDIVFVAQGTVGQIGIIPLKTPYQRYILSQNLMKVTCDANKVDPFYVFYYFKSSRGKQEILSHVNPTGVPCISQPLTSLKGFKLTLPSLPDQHAIAAIIGALDDKIELNQRISQTLEAMAQAIFKSWFVDFDPVHYKAAGQDPPGLAPYIADLFPDTSEDSELGEIPKGWQVHPLPDVFEINPNRSLPKGTLASYLDMANMPTKGPLPESWAIREFGSGMKFINGDTLIARITPCLENGKTAYVAFLSDGEVGWGSTEYIVLRPKGAIPPLFAYLFARTDKFRTFAIQQMTGSSGRQRVPATSLEKYRIALPDIDSELFKHFGNLVSPMFDQIKAITIQSRTLAELRDALLPKLMSGKLTLPNAEGIIGRYV